MERTFQVLVKGQPVSFTSPFTDAEAQAKIRELKNNAFAFSLASKQLWALSAKQIAWIHKLAVDMAAPKVAPAKPQASTALDMAPVMTLFAKAAAHLKYPKITLRTGSGVNLKLVRSVKHNGAVNIASEDKVHYYGRIQLDGSYEPTSRTTPEVITVLKELAKDPARVAANYGKLTGHCCFCCAELSDPRSTNVGYGPICAGHYGLPWTPAEIAAWETKAAEQHATQDWHPTETIPEDHYAV